MGASLSGPSLGWIAGLLVPGPSYCTAIVPGHGEEENVVRTTS